MTALRRPRCVVFGSSARSVGSHGLASRAVGLSASEGNACLVVLGKEYIHSCYPFALVSHCGSLAIEIPSFLIQIYLFGPFGTYLNLSINLVFPESDSDLVGWTP